MRRRWRWGRVLACTAAALAAGAPLAQPIVALTPGETATVGARVVAGTGLVRTNPPVVYLTDGSGGLRLLPGPGTPALLSGDSVRVAGTVSRGADGMPEMHAPVVTAVPAATRAPEVARLPVEPRPDGTRGPDLAVHLGRLVEIDGTVLHLDRLPDHDRLMLLSGTTLVPVVVYHARATPIDLAALRAGSYVRVRGVAIPAGTTGADDALKRTFAVLPLAPSDVSAVGLSPAVVRRLALGTFGLLALAVLWGAVLRREVRRRTQALHTSERRYSTLFDAAADPVLVLDGTRGGRVLQANAAAQRAFGIAPDGTRLSAGSAARRRPLVLPEVAPDPGAVVEHLEIAARRAAATGVVDLRRADGQTVPFELATRRLAADGAGSDDAGLLVSVARDVAERRAYETGLLHAMHHAEEARAQAEAAARLKATILANMSHELRTPLTAILGYAEILVEEVAPDLTEYAETVRTGGHRLLNTLNDILDLSRLDSAPDAGPPEPFDVVATVRAAAEAAAPAAQAAGLALRFEADVAEGAPGATVVQPREAFARVAGILLGNAVKFTERGEIHASVHTAPGFVALRVRDTGVGISEAFLPELFEPFTQESDGQSRRFEGNGLGLALARRLAEHMGGEIRVWSRKGEGSLFEVALPRLAPGTPYETVGVASDASAAAVGTAAPEAVPAEPDAHGAAPVPA